MSKINDYLFRLFVYYKGVKFFKIDDLSNAALVSSGTFLINGHKSLRFCFYKKSYEDVVYKRGFVEKETLTGYMVECEFDESFPQNLREFNNMKFVIRNSPLFSKLSEKFIMHFLIEFYIDYIKQNLPEDDEDSRQFI